METDMEAMLRLAWFANRRGCPGTRDALLTLAMTSFPRTRSTANLPEDFGARCRSVLSRRLPADWFDAGDSTSLRIRDEKVSHTLAKLHLMFPRIRIRRLLMRAEILQGPYTSKRPKIDQILLDLKILDNLPKASAPSSRTASLPFPGSHPATVEVDPNPELLAFYWSILLAMAALVNVALQTVESGRDQRAA